jgi:hypothetical protein
VYLPLELSPGTPALEMEVDSGSRSLILDQRFMASLGIEPGGAGVKQVEGHDETGQAYVRFFASLPRAVNVAGAPTVRAPAGSKVMFQRIIHDGLVGQDFLRQTAVTFDIEHAAMIFARR